MGFKVTAVWGKSIGFQLVVGIVCLLQRGEGGTHSMHREKSKLWLAALWLFKLSEA